MSKLNQLPESCLASVGSSAFLLEAVKLLVYKTPQKIVDYVEKHKHDCLIKNPPYVIRK
ncbi:hypothetical protein [Flavobacterium praedii]|uniref:hypothetical protein n=1 Tax=Flavobacterium praedii TaxID=3002900 RepID=UPI0024819FD1|nr:hypothetical protein [Flavobacterium praedii]